MTAVGCGDSPSRHPDTGAGANQPVPPTQNCQDMCQRLADCLVILCNEDTMSTRYEGLQDLVAADCLSTCTDATVMSMVSASAWQCLFQSSCRQTLEYQECIQPSSYHCT
jgi:hypothetical protein